MDLIPSGISFHKYIFYTTISINCKYSYQSSQDKIVQYGVDGLKEVTYKVKYQNEKEIEKK